MVFCSIWLVFLQCVDTVGWVIWPVKTRPRYDLYCVGGTLSLAQSINQSSQDSTRMQTVVTLLTCWWLESRLVHIMRHHKSKFPSLEPASKPKSFQSESRVHIELKRTPVQVWTWLLQLCQLQCHHQVLLWSRRVSRHILSLTSILLHSTDTAEILLCNL